MRTSHTCATRFLAGAGSISLVTLFSFLCLGSPAATASSIINFSGNGGQGAIGNEYCYSSSGVPTACNGAQFLTVTAWSDTGSNNDLAAAAVGQYDPYGLGVCNYDELHADGGCQSPQHAIDNQGQFDFVLLQFSSSVTLDSVTLNTFGEALNTNATYYTNTVTDSTVAGKSISGLGTGTNSTDGGHTGDRTVTLDLGNVTDFLLGACVSSCPEGFDYFKLQNITIDTGGGGVQSLAPEPWTLGLTGFGLVGFGLIRRRVKS